MKSFMKLLFFGHNDTTSYISGFVPLSLYDPIAGYSGPRIYAKYYHQYLFYLIVFKLFFNQYYPKLHLVFLHLNGPPEHHQDLQGHPKALALIQHV